MLEDLAHQYSAFSEANPQLVPSGTVVIGAIVAALFNRSESELRRAPYFALIGFFCLLTAVVLLGLTPFLVQAIVGGFFWIIVAVEALAAALFGFFFGRIAMARSRDAYGHNYAAILAFIPILNLWLLFMSSKNPISANQVPTIPLLTGGLGVLSGFVMLAGGAVITNYSLTEGERAVERAIEAGVFVERFLGQTLEQMAKGISTPMTLDEITILLRVETDERTLRYVYEVSSDLAMLAVSMRTGLVKQNCTHQDLRPVIEAGATIEHLYLRPDRSEVGTVTVTRKICGY